MNIKMTLVPGFEELYDKYANDPTGCKLLEMEGISPSQLDVGISNHKFFEEKLSDISSDGNSNWTSDNITPTAYRTFTTNGQMKLLGYHMLWYYSEKRYGREFADKAISMIWDGSLYFHDAHGLRIQMPYCYAFSLDKIVFEGRPYGPSPNTPPKNRKSYISQVDKLISDLSKQFAGATAPSDFFLWYAYFCKLENLDVYSAKDIKSIVQDLQGLVCLFNDASRAEGEPPFTNISIYDSIGLESLFGHIIYPDGTKPDMDYIMELQKIFCEWFSHGDPITGFPYRFPVVTQNLTTDDNGNFIDSKHAEWVAEVNKNMANFNLHFGEKNRIAMCSYSDDTEILTNNGWKLISDCNNSDSFATVNIDTKAIEWHHATYFHKYISEKMHHYYNDKRMFDMLVTPNHEMLCKSKAGNWIFRKSEDLGTGHKLVRRTDLYNGISDKFSKLVGFYIGDGYKITNRNMIGFNLKREKKISYLINLLDELNIKYNIGNPDKNGMILISVHDDTLLNIAEQIGKAKDKYIPEQYKYDLSKAHGVLDGLMNSDGNWDSNRYWTTSDQLRDDVMEIACILGYQPWYHQFDREVELRGKEYQNNTYEIKLLTVETLCHATQFRTEIDYNRYAYCIDVPNHTIFVRRNGIASLSSNCRYENNLDDMSLTPDSFGNGGVNIGSHRVITPNYGRAALLSGGDEDKFIEILDDYFDVSARLLNIHRKDILEKRIERTPGYLTFFGELGWFNLDTMFSTFGLVGIYEAVDFMGYDIMDDDGTEFTLDLMAHIKNKIKEYRNEYQCVFNAEEIPGEQACVSLIQKDKILIKSWELSEIVYEKLSLCDLYSNQYIPLINNADMITRIDLSGRFMDMISGGGIVHANAEAPIDSTGKMLDIMKFAAKSKVSHIAICYRFGRCEDHKATIIGQGTDRCPICNKPIIHTRARVIGYFSDEYNWNPVRKKCDAPFRHYSDMTEWTEEI